MSKFIDNSPREIINSVIPLTENDYKNIKTGLNIIDNNSNISYEDVVDYFKWTKTFLKRLALLDEKLKLSIINTSDYVGVDLVEVSDTNEIKFHSSSDDDFDEDDDFDDDDDDDDFDDEDEDEYEDDDDDELDEHPNQYVHQHFN